MALIALEFEDNQILVATARTAAKRIQVQHLFTVDIGGTDADAADKLRSALAQHGASKSDAIVVVRRGDAEIRLLDVPPAPDSELPDIVRFIARNEFASLNDNWLMDFIRLDGDQHHPGQVLGAGVSPEMSKQIKTITEAAGLKLKHIVLQPFATVDAVYDQIHDDAFRLLLEPGEGQMGVTLTRGSQLVATRTIRATPGVDDAGSWLVPHIKRMIVSSVRATGDQPVKGILILGTEQQYAELGRKLESSLETQVKYFDPFHQLSASMRSKLGTGENRFIAMLGALNQQAANRPHALDFLNPRRPKVKKLDLTKWYLYGGLAAAAALTCAAVGWWILQSQATEIAGYEATLSDLKRKNSGDTGQVSVDQTLAEVGEIDNWMLSQVNWQEELLAYSSRSLTPDDAIVDLFDAQAGIGGEPGKIIVSARTADYKTEGRLIDTLSEQFVVNTTRTGDAEDRDYPIATSLRIALKQAEDAVGKSLDQINAQAAEYVKSFNARRTGDGAASDQPDVSTAPASGDQEKPPTAVAAPATSQEKPVKSEQADPQNDDQPTSQKSDGNSPQP